MRLAEGPAFIQKPVWGVKPSKTSETITGAWEGVNGQRGPVNLAPARLSLEIPTAFDRLEQRHFVGILDIHPDRNAIGDTRDPGPERFQLVR